MRVYIVSFRYNNEDRTIASVWENPKDAEEEQLELESYIDAEVSIAPIELNAGWER